MEPLRIGILGTARITELAMVSAAAMTGHRLVAIAARDPDRAEEYARAHGIERALPDYRSLLLDPEVEVVYNPLVNAWHGPLNIAALQAGKHVLTEKPSANNGAEARRVDAAARLAGRHLVEGFHYLHHPVMRRMLEIVGSGALGAIERTDVSMTMPEPSGDDPRWDLALGGGAGMDLGCYGLHASRFLGRYLGGEPTVVSAKARERRGRPGVDERLDAEILFPDGTTGQVVADMSGRAVDFHCRVRGNAGEALAVNFVQPHVDDRILINCETGSRTEHLGKRSSYAYQLESLAALLRDGCPLPTAVDDPVTSMELLDSIYSAAGLAPRSAIID